MSALSFTKSPDFQDASKCLAFLTEKGADIHDGLTAEMPAVVFHGYFTPEAIAEWDRAATEAELREKAEGAWDEYKSQEPTRAVKIAVQALECGSWTSSKKMGSGLFITEPKLIEDVCEFLQTKQFEVVEARYKELNPQKYKSKATGKRAAKRSNSEFECVITNTAEDAQGKDYEYCLPCDYGSTMLKDGKIQVGKGENGKDRKPQTYKAIKKKTPFLTEGGCKCGITWDRASGSKKLSELGVKGAFVMGCDQARVSGSDFCKKHQNKKPEDSVFETTYKTGTHKGKTHAQVLWILNEEEGDVLSGDSEWVKTEVGSKWQ